MRNMLLTEAAKNLGNETECGVNAVDSATATSSSLRSRSKGNEEKLEKVDSQPVKGKLSTKPPEEFYKHLQQFHEKRNTPIQMPKISGREVNLYLLYCEVTERGGFQKVNMRDEWEEIMPELGLKEKCVNGTAALKYIYRRILEKYERQNFFGEDPDKVDTLESSDLSELVGRGGRPRYPSSLHASANASSINNVSMVYNYRQHIVSMERRRQFKLSTDLYKASPYEKLMLSLLSPLPNEQDFAINTCTLMANESKHTLRLNEYPKLLDGLLAHTGVFSDYTTRKLFEHVYCGVRRHSLHAFWRDLLHGRPQILELYTDEQAAREASLVDDIESHGTEWKAFQDECMELNFFNLGRGLGTQDYVGQRVLQVISILRNLSFFEENVTVFVKNRTFLRFLVMSSNIRWSNVHIQALEIAGNIASELELYDPTLDDLSRSFMATLCDGVESADRAVIINCLEILYKLCQKDSNEDYVLKCLNLNFYKTIALFLSLNDIMLLIFTLETIYALTSLGTKSCHLVMQVKGMIDQLISLITVEAQSYGPDGCILMRVIETIPGNMLPMVAQNIANLQNVATIQNQPLQTFNPPQNPVQIKPQIMVPPPQHQQQQVEIADTSGTGSSNVSAEQSAGLQVSQSCTQDDEQYALAWLGATFERTSNVESHIEQQELYRMYLTYCQKSGKHSIVNHVQFPRLVRLLFTNTVGPVVVRKTDGSELPGLHYITVRMRAQPLPLQGKATPNANMQVCTSLKIGDTSSTLRKIKKKIKPELYTPTVGTDNSSVPSETSAKESSSPGPSNVNETTANIGKQPSLQQSVDPVDSSKVVEKMDIEEPQDAASKSYITAPETMQSSLDISNNPPQIPSSFIKSLLANKVNQRQQKQKDSTSINTTTNTIPTSPISSMTTTCGTQASVIAQPIKVASTAISALVNNPLMQNTPVKVGQTTIKPLNPQMTIEKKTITDSTPPPLAPLSGNNVAKDANGRPIILANQMLVDILDKKIVDSPLLNSGKVKRKLDEPDASSKRQSVEINVTKEEPQVTPSKNAANLYAEMAASILEDEDLDDIPPVTQTSQLSVEQQQPSQAPIILPTKMQAPNQTGTLQNVQRQLLFQTNQAPQIKLSQSNASQTPQLPNAMATIKTDQGLQTVPVIFQQKPLESNQPTAQIIQQVIQQATQPQQTQYVLATNPQGQTYLVTQQATPQTQAPQPPQPTQTVLVTHTPQQQSAGTKTIIILQQQTLSGPPTQQQIITNATGTGQKMIMTTSQGQQVLVTQRPQTPQQIFINPQTGAATHIHTHMPVGAGQPANLIPRQIIQTTQQIQQPQQITAGQISPSLLNQLNQIPATIKLHQPAQPQQPQPPQPATISRIGKTVSILQTGPGSNATPVAIPQLQQHQSIIQQHIISGGTPEKRHVLLGGGRAIEIKETIPEQTTITQSKTVSQPTAIVQTAVVPVTASTQTIVGNIKRSNVVGGSPAIVKPSLPVVKLPTTSNIGPPPPLAPATLTTTTITPNDQATQKPHSPQDIQRKDDVAKVITSYVATATNAGNPAAPLTTLATTSTTASTSSTPKVQVSSSVVATTANNNITYTASNTNTIPSTGIQPALQVPSTQKAQQQQQPQTSTVGQQQTTQLSAADAQWLYICDWRNCPRYKFKSLNDLQYHVCTSHAPDHLDAVAEIFCQWGVGPGLCDGIPRKRFALMTHLIERHLTHESLRAAIQRRLATGIHNINPIKPPVTIVRNMEQSQKTANSSSSSPSSSSSNSQSQAPVTGPSALQAIKRHTAEFVNAKELMDENEGPVTKSIRLTAALILRNLVAYTTTAKRSVRRYEPHLASIALSNVESSGTIANILAELNN
uniref:ARID domain-containing protein n=1 Tax=Glossina brevipalpis TaxID=37001 RepID=A0A1A9WJD6_9MUSC